MSAFGGKADTGSQAAQQDEARRIAANIAKLPSDLAEASMSTLTIYLARLIGLSAVLLVAALLVRGNALIMDIQSRSGTSNHTRAQRLVRR